MPRAIQLRNRRFLPPQPKLDLSPFTLGPADADTAYLLIHGFSGSPPEMRWLGQYLAERGARVLGVRLAGHGTQPEELTDITWRDWLQSAREGLEKLVREGHRVVIVGFSMGGLLGMHLSAAYPSQVSRLITISSPIYFRDPRIHLIPMVRHVVRWHRVRQASANSDPEAHTRYYAYRRYPLIAVDQLLNLMRATRKLLPSVRTQTLIMQGLRDRVVHPKSAKYIFKHIGSPDKELVWWQRSGHGVVFDVEREAVWRKVWDFACAAN